MSNMNLSEMGGIYPQKQPRPAGENLKSEDRISTGSVFDNSEYSIYYDEDGNPTIGPKPFDDSAYSIYYDEDGNPTIGPKYSDMQEKFDSIKEKYLDDAERQELEEQGVEFLKPRKKTLEYKEIREREN